MCSNDDPAQRRPTPAKKDAGELKEGAPLNFLND